MQTQMFPGVKGQAGTVGEADTCSQLPAHL